MISPDDFLAILGRFPPQALTIKRITRTPEQCERDRQLHEEYLDALELQQLEQDA